MDTERLRYFCAIVDSGGLTKASEFLGVSHSGLSKAMSVLQGELGYKVLTPKGRGLELTDQGKLVYEQARKILEMVGSLQGQAPVAEKTVRIGFPEALALVASESIARELKREVTIEDLDSGELEAKVMDRRCDFAFTFVPFPHKELDHLKICTANVISYAVAGAFHGVPAEKIPYVIPSSELRDNPLSIRIRDGWNSNLARLTPYRANSLSIALKMVQAGVCAIYAPNFLIKSLNESLPKGRRFVELELPPSRQTQERTRRDVFLVKRVSEDESKEMKIVAKVVRQVCR